MLRNDWTSDQTNEYKTNRVVHNVLPLFQIIQQNDRNLILAMRPTCERHGKNSISNDGIGVDVYSNTANGHTAGTKTSECE